MIVIIMRNTQVRTRTVPRNHPKGGIAFFVYHIKRNIIFAMHASRRDQGDTTTRQRFRQRRPRRRTILLKLLFLEPTNSQRRKTTKEKREKSVLQTLKLHSSSVRYASPITRD